VCACVCVCVCVCVLSPPCAGATRTPSNKELLYARQSIVAHAKAFDMQAIDIVNIRFKDTGALEDEAREGYMMGFTGKQVIHPNQV
jgi:citrate lyase subunit beta-like protein